LRFVTSKSTLATGYTILITSSQDGAVYRSS